jgi:mannosyltransferase OCH1-like enzyme
MFPLKESYNSIIPLDIYQTWSSKELPPKMKNFRDQMIQENPEFTFHLYDDEDCEKFIQEYFHPLVLWAYQSLKPGAYKADLWRYCILFIKGGIYVDIKYRPINGFHFIALSEKNHFVKDFSFIKKKEIAAKNGGIYNALLISTPHNPIFQKCIQSIVINVKNRFYGVNPLSPSGPLLLKHMISEDEKKKIQMQFHRIKEIILYQGIPILQYYPDYRKEQKRTNPHNHYHELWTNKDIYKKIPFPLVSEKIQDF